jgi:hypothetical protein
LTNKIPNNIEIDDPVLSENDCVVNKSFNVLNTSSTNQFSDTNVNNDSSLQQFSLWRP